MSEHDDDVADCQLCLAEERQALADLSGGRLSLPKIHRENPEYVTPELLERHKERIAHWLRELAKLGVIDSQGS